MVMKTSAAVVNDDQTMLGWLTYRLISRCPPAENAAYLFLPEEGFDNNNRYSRPVRSGWKSVRRNDYGFVLKPRTD
jgi:hypothetical protein